MRCRFCNTEGSTHVCLRCLDIVDQCVADGELLVGDSTDDTDDDSDFVPGINGCDEDSDVEYTDGDGSSSVHIVKEEQKSVLPPSTKVYSLNQTKP